MEDLKSYCIYLCLDACIWHALGLLLSHGLGTDKIEKINIEQEKLSFSQIEFKSQH